MLEKIKSSYFIKLLFYYINNKRQLKLIKHNKAIKNLIDINLFHYKLFSGRYIIYKSNNKGKVYDSYNDQLIFEGDYLNGEKNGKGKEYDYNGNIIFEGEYFKDKRHGKGREYNRYGELKFKGEYKKGKKWNGKGYNSRKEILYKIEGGKGLIIEYDFIQKIRFEGNYVNG